MSVTYLLKALKFVRWFCLLIGLAALVRILVDIVRDIPRNGLSLFHVLLPVLLLAAIFIGYRFAEMLLLLSLNRTLRKLYMHGKELPDDDLSQRVRQEIAYRERFHQFISRLYVDVEMSEILDRVCSSGRIQKTQNTAPKNKTSTKSESWQ